MKFPLKLGNYKPQGIEILDGNDDPLMLVYGETKKQTKVDAEYIITQLEKANSIDWSSIPNCGGHHNDRMGY